MSETLDEQVYINPSVRCWKNVGHSEFVQAVTYVFIPSLDRRILAESRTALIDSVFTSVINLHKAKPEL